MNILQTALMTASALVTINYKIGGGKIILMVDHDVSLLGWGAVLMQINSETG